MTARDLLRALGIDPALRGFYYLEEAIALRASDPMGKITAIYYSVSLRFNTTATAIERAMRFAITVALDRYGCEAFCEILKQPPTLDGSYTVGQFLSLAALACADSCRH